MMQQAIREVRFPFAVLIGGGISLTLFVFMQQLIVTNYSAFDSMPELNPITTVRVQKQPEIITDPVVQPKPEETVEQPEIVNNPVTATPGIDRIKLELFSDPGSNIPPVFGNEPGHSVTAVNGYAPLRIKARFRPLYPPLAAKQGIEGSVMTCFAVTAAGSVTNAHVVGASSPQVRRMLSQAALQTIQQWTFFPRMVKGQAVATPSVCQNINFKMN
ncbi:MAG: TonB family protein, partial [Nitrosospira sp.]|nr:TonB family protein [Nitrosospira sp.]